MSNYNFQEIPDSLRDHADHLRVGAEVVNGTGLVELVLWNRNADDPGCDSLSLRLSVAQAKDFVGMMWAAACEAERVYLLQGRDPNI